MSKAGCSVLEAPPVQTMVTPRPDPVRHLAACRKIHGLGIVCVCFFCGQLLCLHEGSSGVRLQNKVFTRPNCTCRSWTT